MNVADVECFAQMAPLAQGYRFELLKRSEVRILIDALTRWFPDISVGGASCFLDESFYARKVFFADAQHYSRL